MQTTAPFTAVEGAVVVRRRTSQLLYADDVLVELSQSMADIRAQHYPANVKIRMHAEDIRLLRQRFMGGNDRLDLTVLLGLEIVSDDTVGRGAPEAEFPS